MAAKRLSNINTLYVFEDGYAFWTVGRLSAAEKAAEVRQHGRIVRMATSYAPQEVTKKIKKNAFKGLTKTIKKVYNQFRK